MRQARLGQLVSRFILAAVAHQLATRGGRKVALVLESDLTAVVEPEGFCAACHRCFDAEGVFRLPLSPDKVRQAVERGVPTADTCPAGLAFLAEPLAIGPAHVIGYLAVGHVTDVKALEERLFAMAQEADDKPASLANDADAGAALLPPGRVSSLPEVVAFKLFPGTPARIASLRAELERELAHQAAVAIASLPGHPALAAAGFTQEGFRSALLSRSAVLGEGGPVFVFLFRKPLRGRPEELVLAQEWARSLALLYLTVSARERESSLAATVHALGELSEAVEGGALSACGQVLARWAARCTGGTAAVFVPDERREPKLLAHSAGADHAGPLLSACRWLARQALVRRVTITASSDLIGKEEETEGRAGLVVAHPLGTGSKVPAVLAVAWPREEGDRVLGRQFDPEVVQALLAALKAPEVRETYSSLFQEAAPAPKG